MYWLVVDDRKELKSLLRKWCPIKDHGVSERVELRLSSRAFISVSIFLTKIDIFCEVDLRRVKQKISINICRTIILNEEK